MQESKLAIVLMALLNIYVASSTRNCQDMSKISRHAQSVICINITGCAFVNFFLHRVNTEDQIIRQ